jgi:hypothetical protein
MIEPENSSPRPAREYKHLAIHLLVEQDLLVFENIAEKKSIDVIVGLQTEGELRTAGIRIKTSSLNTNNETGEKYWAFTDRLVKELVEKTPFFYVFCCQKRTEDESALIREPWFLVVSSARLKEMGKAGPDGTYNFSIYEKHLELEWKRHKSDFKQIRDYLQKNSQTSIQLK